MAKRRPSGDGMVRKRDDGRWEGRIVVGHKDNGDSIFRYVYADTQKELTARLRKCITAYQGVDLTEQSRLTLSEWLDQWLVSKEGMVRPGTLNGYRGYIENHIRPCLGEKRISQIKAVDIQRFYDMLSRKLASGTVRRIHTTLHGILKAAAQARLIPRNPVEEVTPPKFSYQEKKVLTAEQVDRLLEVIQKDTLWHDLFYTELTTGLRRGELCGLRWEDFDAASGSLKVCRTVRREKGKGLTIGDTKTYAGTRTITLPPSLAVLLKERKRAAKTAWIFPDLLRPERPTAPDAAYRRMKLLLEQAGLPDIRFHDLRHPYVKHTTKIFSLRLMGFQAQAYPDARRKTRGACQLHRGGQSRSPVRPLCNRKRFSCLPPQAKMSWILYAISMRLSGYTSTRSISSSASSVVSVSASKIALDAFLRLSCRACSSCFFFACANTAA